MSALDKQVGGNHYKQFKIQPTEFIHANGLGFIVGNIIKYACRAGLKGSKEQDIDKIIHYCELLKDLDALDEHEERWATVTLCEHPIPSRPDATPSEWDKAAKPRRRDQETRSEYAKRAIEGCDVCE